MINVQLIFHQGSMIKYLFGDSVVRLGTCTDALSNIVRMIESAVFISLTTFIHTIWLFSVIYQAIYSMSMLVYYNKLHLCVERITDHKDQITTKWYWEQRHYCMNDNSNFLKENSASKIISFCLRHTTLCIISLKSSIVSMW